MKVTILDDYHGTLRTLDCFATLAGRSASTATAASSPATARRSAWTCRCGHAPTRASAPAPTDTPWRRARRRSSPNRSTPHIGYVTRDEYELQFADVFAQIAAYAAGTPANVVNPGALKRVNSGGAR